MQQNWYNKPYAVVMLSVIHWERKWIINVAFNVSSLWLPAMYLVFGIWHLGCGQLIPSSEKSQSLLWPLFSMTCA